MENKKMTIKTTMENNIGIMEMDTLNSNVKILE